LGTGQELTYNIVGGKENTLAMERLHWKTCINLFRRRGLRIRQRSSTRPGDRRAGRKKILKQDTCLLEKKKIETRLFLSLKQILPERGRDVPPKPPRKSSYPFLLVGGAGSGGGNGPYNGENPARCVTSSLSVRKKKKKKKPEDINRGNTEGGGNLWGCQGFKKS